MRTQLPSGRAVAPFVCTVSILFSWVAYAQPADEVVVTGVPHGRAPSEIAQAVGVVRGDELDRSRAATLGETLAGQLGISSSFFGTGASRPIIRGLAGARVRVLEDGLGSMDVATVSDDHAVTVEPMAAEQIEVFRGPTTLLYGSGAVGGVVNTVTARIPTRAPDDAIAGAFELRGDTVADSRGGALRLDGGGSRFAWHFDGSRRDAGDYAIPRYAHVDAEPGDERGIVENSAAETTAAAIGGSWLADERLLGASVSLFESLYGVPGHGHAEEGDEHSRVRIDVQQRRFDLKSQWSSLGGAIDGVYVRAALTDYEHVELEGAEIGTRFTNDASEVRVELLHAPVGRFSGAFGLQLGDRDFAASGDEAFVPPVDTQSRGLFVVEQLDLPRWQMSFGARIESQRHEPSNGAPAIDDTGTSVSLGALRTLRAGYSLAATLSSSERLPVAEELYSNGPHLATGVVQIGDAAIRGETGRHVDLSLRREVGELTFAVTAFKTHYDDFIYLADSGAVDAVHELPIFVYTQHDANFVGIEAETFLPIATPGPGEIDLRLFADYVRGELANGDPLPRMPPLRYGARLQYHDERMLVGLEATHYDAQDRIAAFETRTAGYTLVNADFRWRLTTGDRLEIEAFMTASNLGDDEARKHTAFIKHIAPLPGRNYTVGLRSRF